MRKQKASKAETMMSAFNASREKRKSRYAATDGMSISRNTYFHAMLLVLCILGHRLRMYCHNMPLLWSLVLGMIVFLRLGLNKIGPVDFSFRYQLFSKLSLIPSGLEFNLAFCIFIED